jgi:foldase protein PrsA
VVRNQFKPDIEEKVFGLSKGETTDPIKSDQGYFIFRLKEKHPERMDSLDEAKDHIAHFLFTQKFKEKMAAWLKEQRESSYIEIKAP